jgi:hypothetical protein
VESSCELGIEPSGSMKCWKLSSGLASSGLSSSAQLHIVSYITIKFNLLTNSELICNNRKQHRVKLKPKTSLTVGTIT